MAPTIRIDDEVYAWLQSQARPFEDTPNTVLRRIGGLGDMKKAKSPRTRRPHEASMRTAHSQKMPQRDFRNPLLLILKQHGGELDRIPALKQLEDVLGDRLTEYDKSDISSGTIRWQKSAEWEVRTMREEGLLKPVSETRRGVWALTDKGLQEVSELASG